MNRSRLVHVLTLAALLVFTFQPNQAPVSASIRTDAVATKAAADSGGWTSNGPFGGNLWDPVLDPNNSNRLFASANGVGLFVSTDGGASWNSSFVADNAGQVHFSPAGATVPAIYLEGDGIGM